MLDLPRLEAALKAGQQRAGVCRRWCSVGVGIDPTANVIECWHNGSGSDTDHQWVWRQTRLDMNEASLAGLICFWIAQLHANGEKVDLNGPLG